MVWDLGEIPDPNGIVAGPERRPIMEDCALGLATGVLGELNGLRHHPVNLLSSGTDEAQT